MPAGSLPTAARYATDVRLVRHVAVLALEATRFGFATRRYALVVLVLFGIVAVALAVTAQATAPLVLYPFA